MSEIEGSDPKVHGIDRTWLTFSQAQGYEELPHPLRLEEISLTFRADLWNLLNGDAVIYDDKYSRRSINRNWARRGGIHAGRLRRLCQLPVTKTPRAITKIRAGDVRTADAG